MLDLLKKIATDDEGQDLAEYGIALAVVSVGVGAIALATAGNVNALWTNAQTAIAAV
jgi:Flp pilus assembly pilin Flp